MSRVSPSISLSLLYTQSLSTFTYIFFPPSFSLTHLSLFHTHILHTVSHMHEHTVPHIMSTHSLSLTHTLPLPPSLPPQGSRWPLGSLLSAEQTLQHLLQVGPVTDVSLSQFVFIISSSSSSDVLASVPRFDSTNYLGKVSFRLPSSRTHTHTHTHTP